MSEISIVTPIYCEEKNINTFLERLIGVTMLISLIFYINVTFIIIIILKVIKKFDIIYVKVR